MGGRNKRSSEKKKNSVVGGMHGKKMGVGGAAAAASVAQKAAPALPTQAAPVLTYTVLNCEAQMARLSLHGDRLAARVSFEGGGAVVLNADSDVDDDAIEDAVTWLAELDPTALRCHRHTPAVAILHAWPWRRLAEFHELRPSAAGGRVPRRPGGPGWDVAEQAKHHEDATTALHRIVDGAMRAQRANRDTAQRADTVRRCDCCENPECRYYWHAGYVAVAVLDVVCRPWALEQACALAARTGGFDATSVALLQLCLRGQRPLPNDVDGGVGAARQHMAPPPPLCLDATALRHRRSRVSCALALPDSPDGRDAWLETCKALADRMLDGGHMAVLYHDLLAEAGEVVFYDPARNGEAAWKEMVKDLKKLYGARMKAPASAGVELVVLQNVPYFSPVAAAVILARRFTSAEDVADIYTTLLATVAGVARITRPLTDARLMRSLADTALLRNEPPMVLADGTLQYLLSDGSGAILSVASRLRALAKSGGDEKEGGGDNDKKQGVVVGGSSVTASPLPSPPKLVAIQFHSMTVAARFSPDTGGVLAVRWTSDDVDSTKSMGGCAIFELSQVLLSVLRGRALWAPQEPIVWFAGGLFFHRDRKAGEPLAVHVVGLDDCFRLAAVVCRSDVLGIVLLTRMPTPNILSSTAWTALSKAERRRVRADVDAMADFGAELQRDYGAPPTPFFKPTAQELFDKILYEDINV